MATNKEHEDQYFPYKLEARWKGLYIALRLKKTDGVTLTANGNLVATYGPAKVVTPLTNVDHTLVTGDHRWYTAVGIRGSFVDTGLTFGTNHRAGLCIAFKEPVPKVIGPRDHDALWVSVADAEGLAAAIERLL